MTTPQHKSYLKLPANYAELSRVDQRRWIAQAATHIQATIVPPTLPGESPGSDTAGHNPDNSHPDEHN